MKLEDQVSSIEASMMLKELEVKQDSYFSWILSKSTGRVLLSPSHLILTRRYERLCSAFTVAELGEMLKYNLQLYYTDHDEDYHITAFGKAVFFTDSKEADARAKMLIYLKEKEIKK